MSAALRASALALTCAALATNAYGGPTETAATLLATRAPAVVFVHAMVKFEAAALGRSYETEDVIEGPGIVVTPSGLVLVGTSTHLWRARARQTPGSSVRFTPSDVKILFDKGTWETHTAVVVARDDDLGLAYAQIDDLDGGTVPHVDLSTGRDPVAGETLYCVDRLPRSMFDGPPEVRRGHVVGLVERPRVMWNLRGDARNAGLPLFDATGTPVGLIAIQYSSEKDLVDEETGPSRVRPFLVPLEPVRASIAKALALAPKALAQAREKRAAGDPVREDADPAEPKPKNPAGPK